MAKVFKPTLVLLGSIIGFSFVSVAAFAQNYTFTPSKDDLSGEIIRIQQDFEGAVMRLEQQMERLNGENEQLRKDIRALQRENEALGKKLVETSDKAQQNQDDMVRVRNLDIANLKASQKSVMESVPVLNWGAQERDCKDFGQHQQVVVARQGNKTLRSVCYDGKLIHLGTELNEAP